MAFGKSKDVTGDDGTVDHEATAEASLEKARKNQALPSATTTLLATQATAHAVMALLAEQRRTNELLEQLLRKP